MVKITTIKMDGHSRRTSRAEQMWLEWIEYYNQGVPIDEFLRKYKKPNGKYYTRQYFYVAIKRLRDRGLIEIINSEE